MHQTDTRVEQMFANSTIGETANIIVSPSASLPTPPQLVLDARNKFAPQIVRFLADLTMAHSNTDPSEVMDLHQLSEDMDIWRQLHVTECEPS